MRPGISLVLLVALVAIGLIASTRNPAPSPTAPEPRSDSRASAMPDGQADELTAVPSPLPIRDSARPRTAHDEYVDGPQSKTTPWIYGQIVPDGPLPPGAIRGIRVRRWMPDEGSIDRRHGPLSDWRESMRFAEYAYVRVEGDGSFKAPRHADARAIEVELDSDYLILDRSKNHGYFVVGRYDDPKDKIYDVPVHVGADVTVRLQFPVGTTDAEIAALEGAEVLFELPAGPHSATTRRFGIVDRRGTIRLPAVHARTWSPTTYLTDFDLPPRSHRPDKSIEPFYFEVPFEFRVRSGTTPHVVLPLKKASNVWGHVVDTEGDPIDGATLTVRYRGHPWVYPIERTVVTDPNGRFEFHGVRDDLHSLHVVAKGFAHDPLDVAGIHELFDQPSPISITMERGHDIAVACALPSGIAVKNVPVYATTYGDGASARRAMRIGPVRTDRSGVARFEGLPLGRCLFEGKVTFELPRSAAKQGSPVIHARAFRGGISRPSVTGVSARGDVWLFEGATDETETDSEDVTLIARRAPLLSGKLEWPESGTVTEAFVHIAPASARPFELIVPSERRFQKVAVDLETGYFECTLPPGEFVAVGAACGTIDGVQGRWTRSHAQPFTMGTTDQAMTLPLTHGQSIEGKVIQNSSSERSEVRMHLQRLDVRSFPRMVVDCDAQGRFAFGHVPPGRYRIVAEGDARGVVVELDEGDRIQGLEVSLVSEGGALLVRLGGRAADPDLYSPELVRCRIGDSDFGIRLRPEEDFVLPGLPPGPATVVTEVRLEDGLRYEFVRTAEIVVGEETVMDLSAGLDPGALTRIDGRIVATDFGAQPLVVQLRSGGALIASGAVYAGGEFTLRTPHRGPARVAVTAADSSEVILLFKASTASTVARVDVDVGEEDLDVGELKLPTGGIELIVGWRRDRRLAAGYGSARIEMTSTRGEESAVRRFEVSRGNGRVVARYLPDGSYRLVCVSEGFKMEPVVVRETGGKLTSNVRLMVEER